MLIHDHWFFGRKLSVADCCGATGTRNSERTINIAVASIVIVSFNWIIVVLDHLYQSLVLIFLFLLIDLGERIFLSYVLPGLIL